MTRLRLLVAPTIVVAVVMSVGRVGAADESAPAPTTTTTTTRDPNTTAAVALALKIIASAASAEAEVDGLLATASANGDGVLVAYLTEKKSQLDVVGKIAKARRKLLVAAAGRGDKEVARYLLPMLTSLDARLTELKTQAREGVAKPAPTPREKTAHSSDDAHTKDARSDEDRDDDARDDFRSAEGGSGGGGANAWIFWLPRGALKSPPAGSPTK